VFKNLLNGEEELDEQTYDQMMQEWMQDGKQMQQMEQMMGEWGKTWDQEADDMKLTMPKQEGVIQFAPVNPYMEAKQAENPVDLLARAKELIEEQQVQEAILCLEAEV